MSDPAFRAALATGLPPRVYLPTRLPRNPDYSAPPTVAPGTPIVPARPFWNPRNLNESAGFDASAGGVEAGGATGDFADYGGTASDSGNFDGGTEGLGSEESSESEAQDGKGEDPIAAGIRACRAIYTRAAAAVSPSMIKSIPGVSGSGRSHIAGSDRTLPTAFALFDEGRYQESLSYFQQARSKLMDEEGGVEAALMLGKLYLFAPIAEADTAQALKWLDKAAMSPFDPALHIPAFDPREPERNTATGEAAVILGNVYLKGVKGVSQNPALALKWFKRANDVGHVAAAKIIGDMYYQGRVVPRDLKAAANYYKQAAALDHAPSQYKLAEMLYRGELGSPDIKGALAWYEAAGKYNHAGALYALAFAYETGEGVGTDTQKALVYYKAAALNGNAAAQSAVGTFFYEGNTVAKDDVAARKWFEAAAKQGEPDAMFNLAVMLMKGEGGAVDRTKSWVWFRIAQGRGLAKAGAALAVIEQRMTPDERKAAMDLFAPAK